MWQDYPPSECMGHHQKRSLGLALSSIGNVGAEDPCCRNTKGSCGEKRLLHQRRFSRPSVAATLLASQAKEAGPSTGVFSLLLCPLGKVLGRGGQQSAKKPGAAQRKVFL